MNLGRYEVVRELGKGAMGVVYLARDPVIGRAVALKTIRLTDSGDEEEVREFQQRFVREAQAAGILSHPAIVTVYEIGQDDEKGVSFIAMEYVEGPTLKESLQQGRIPPPAEVAAITAQVADALDFAHAKGIVHRDVKPANIILCADGRVKITDFGIAKITSEANLTTTGQFLGTPNYMAPEQVKGSPVDGRTDIFSLGVVLYECLTRRKPFGGDSLTTISYRIVHEPFDSPHEVNPDISVTFDEVVARCLAKDPKDRYQRARDLAADLRAIAAGRPLPPPPPPGSEATVVGHIPTTELPFPEASVAPAAAAPAPAAAALSAKRDDSFSRTMRRRVPASAFWAVSLLLLAVVAGASAWIWSQRTPVPQIDAQREQMVQRQRQLRIEGAELLRQGNVEAAYQKYSELRKLAPNSPEVASILVRLEQIRGEQSAGEERLLQSQEKFEEGKKLYEAKQYSKAIPLFEEAFNLNPSSTDAVNFLRMSREQLELRQIREAEKAAAERVVVSQAAGSDPAVLAVNFPAELSDGYMMIQLDGEKVLHENLWEETRRGIMRRRTPRPINTSRSVPAGKRQLIVWVIVPSQRITERRVFDLDVKGGARLNLTLGYDERAKKIEMNLG